MSDLQNDTITAIATAPGQSGVGVIRLSGSHATTIAKSVITKIPEPRCAKFFKFRDTHQNIIDEGLVLFFPGPNSFTGEDVIEFHGHGGMIVQDLLLRELINAGARLARPGEFSERAFLNNKLDLTQAEAIADLISASSEQAARSAIRSLQGDFAKQIHGLVRVLIELRMYIEAAIDFPDEEIDFLSEGKVESQIQQLKYDWETILNTAKQGSLLRDGIRVVITGKPNVGKSSLLNALSGSETAIVTDIPGTTRDVLREQITIDGMPMHVIDTAGIRESDDVVEKEGIKRAQHEMQKADCIIFIDDVTNPKTEKITPNQKHIYVKNKIDLLGDHFKKENKAIYISAKTGTGLDELKQKLKEVAGFNDRQQGIFIARRRHLDALQQAKKHFDAAHQQLLEFNAGELVAEELRLAQNALGKITGEFTTEDLLGEIFSSFCIGK